MDLESTCGILGQADFVPVLRRKLERGEHSERSHVRRRASVYSDLIALGHQGHDGARCSIDVRAVKCDCRGIDIEAGKNLSRRVIESEDDLNRAVWVLT